MAETDWTPDETAALDRVPRYNVQDWDAVSNPYGFGEDGYKYNQMRQGADGGIIARGVRRMALSASAQAVLAAQEATTATAERKAAQNAATAAYGSAETAAAEVGKAKTQADRAKGEADRAFGLAQSFNLPAITAEMAGRFVKVNAAGTAWELGEITIATAAQITAGAGKGVVNAETLGPILTGLRAVVGDVIDSLNALSARGGEWMEATNQVLIRATYPHLFDLIGTRYNEFGAIASGSISTRFWDSWGVGLTGVTYMPDGVIYALTATSIQRVTQPKIFRSTDGGLTFTEMAGSSDVNTAPAEVIRFKAGYIAPPRFTVDNTDNGIITSLYSGDGLNWIKDSDGLTSTYTFMSYACSASHLVGVASGTSALYHKTNYIGAWTHANLPQQASSFNRNSIVCLNGVFYYVGQQGDVWKTANPGGAWTSVFTHPERVSNNKGSIFAVLGSLYVISGYGNRTTVYRITEAGVATLVLATDTGRTDGNLDAPLSVTSVQTDGKGRVLLFDSHRAYVLGSDGFTNRLRFGFEGFLTGEPIFLRRSDGLSLRIRSSAKTVVERVMPAVPDTDFQMPTLASPTPGMKRFVRAKP